MPVTLNQVAIGGTAGDLCVCGGGSLGSYGTPGYRGDGSTCSTAGVPIIEPPSFGDNSLPD